MYKSASSAARGNLQLMPHTRRTADADTAGIVVFGRMSTCFYTWEGVSTQSSAVFTYTVDSSERKASVNV